MRSKHLAAQLAVTLHLTQQTNPTTLTSVQPLRLIQIRSGGDSITND